MLQYLSDLHMESNLALQLLPRQKVGTVTKPIFSQAASFYSNIFEIKLKKTNLNIYQYSFDIHPELPSDSDGLIQKIAKVIMPDLKKNIGLICYRGFMAWGKKQMKTVLTCKAQFQRGQVKYSFEVLVKPIKSLGFQAFFNENSENLPAVSQVLNINAKQRLRQDGMVELTPGSYYNTDLINSNKVEGRLNVWRGFDITVSVYNKKLFLQVDPCSRVLREESFFQTIESDRRNLSIEEINLKYKGSPVLRKYGSPKIYKIQEIDYKQTLKSTFYFSKEGKDITYLDYYQKEYGVAIKNLGQPLLKVLADRRVNKQKDKKEKQYIYLVPELVCLTGLTEEQRSNFRVMKNLGEFTKLSAPQRMQETRKMLQILQDDQELMFDINQNPRALNGYKMQTPHIFLGKNREAQVQKGTINLREKVLDPYTFNDMIFVYSIGRNAEDDRRDADDAFSILKTAAKTFGIQFAEPFFLEVKGGNKLEDWTKQLLTEKKNMKKDDQIDIVFFFMKPFEEKLYSELKKFVTFEFNCSSQFARRKLLASDSKGGMSVASKIVMQMNVKNGHALWVVKNQHHIWKEKTVAVAGLASSKGKKGNTLAFVGTTNEELNSYYNDCKQVKGKETICAALFQDFFTQWLQKWFMKNEKQLPKILVIYREGFNEVQARFQFQFEIQGIQNTIQKVKAKAKQPEYNPTIIYILVNKKPNSRIFEGEGKGKNMSYSNPQPGSVIFEELSQGYKEFHLASAVVREGTCTPVSFKVCYETNPDFPLDAISELTYNQTYSYYNWTGSVRVPATLQYANKLAKQYSQIGDEVITEQKNSDLKSKLFYL